MKLILVLIALILGCQASLYGRLDTFEDVGHTTPKKLFTIFDNVYFRSYFDETNQTFTKIEIKQFRVDLWNGTQIVFFKDGTFEPVAKEVYLLFGDTSSLDHITAVVNLNPTVFDVAYLTKQYVNFAMVLELTDTHHQKQTYTLNTVVQIKNDDTVGDGGGSNACMLTVSALTSLIALCLIFI